MVFKISSAGTKRKQNDSKSRSSKKQKLVTSLNASSAPKHKGKGKVFNRETIPIPVEEDEEDVDLSDQDFQLLAEHGSAANFLTTMDNKAIARSKPHTERLHKLSKSAPPRFSRTEILTDSDPDDDSDISGEDIPTDLDGSDSGLYPRTKDSDGENDYETRPRKAMSIEENENKNLVPRLPIKLPDGSVKTIGQRRIEGDSELSSSEDDGGPLPQHSEPVRDDVATGARFGRMAVIDVLRIEPRHLRIHTAKEQLASVCQDIIADPENNLGLLRRLHSFALPSISTPSHPDPVINDILIRKFSILSQCAVFKDIIPGYRIRSLTDYEKSEKVTQAVMRQREFEQGLVGVYQKFLFNMDAEIKGRSELASACLNAMCSMLLRATHFNFRTNILATIVGQLSRKSWTPASELCGKTLVTLFQRDLTGEPSLEAVRFLNRMIKEKRYSVHPNALRCLCHLRLKRELDVRASQTRVDKVNKSDEQQKKTRKKDRLHLSKKARKALKENKAIQNEMKEAEAQIDSEERSSRHTETLKLVFVLYFSILKSPNPLGNPRLLSAALEGIAKFAHLVNVDFFQDLMAVLKEIARVCKTHYLQTQENSSIETAIDHKPPPHQQDQVSALKLDLLCIVTAFELLSGQGEALDIELDEFVNDLYGLILPSCTFLERDQDTSQSHTPNQGRKVGTNRTNFKESIRTTGINMEQGWGDGESEVPTSSLLFLALTRLFETARPTSVAHVPISRVAAFASRLIIASAHFPARIALQTLQFVHRSLLVPYPGLDALLSSEDRIHSSGGSYRAEIDDVHVCNPFGGCWYTLAILQRHGDGEIREIASRISEFIR